MTDVDERYLALLTRAARILVSIINDECVSFSNHEEAEEVIEELKQVYDL